MSAPCCLGNIKDPPTNPLIKTTAFIKIHQGNVEGKRQYSGGSALQVFVSCRCSVCCFPSHCSGGMHTVGCGPPSALTSMADVHLSALQVRSLATCGLSTTQRTRLRITTASHVRGTVADISIQSRSAKQSLRLTDNCPNLETFIGNDAIPSSAAYTQMLVCFCCLFVF